MSREDLSVEHIVRRLEACDPMALDNTPHTDYREAAVLVLLLEDVAAVPQIVLAKRSADIGSYAGQVCFPGGLKEPGDPSLHDTVIREVREELGLEPEDYRIITALDDFRDGRGRLVRPFVAVMPLELFRRSHRLDSSELDSVIYLAVNQLDDLREGQPPGRLSRRLPSYYLTIGEDIVWGLSASILAHFRNAIGGRWLDVNKDNRTTAERVSA